jgi:ubiquinone/menaquinone biosynthesis C-methylase UbiE
MGGLQLMKTSNELQDFYDTYYYDGITEWREIGGLVKSKNIIDICGKEICNAKILDCGAGEGGVMIHIENDPICESIYGLEISDSAITLAKKRTYKKLVEINKYDGYNIPYPDGFFDMAYCVHVLEHVEHPRILLRDIKRVSKYQVFEIPIDYRYWVDKTVKTAYEIGHINIFTPSLFRFLLKTEHIEIINEKPSIEPKMLLKWKEKHNNMKKSAILKNRIKRILRKLLTLPYIKYITDGVGYTAYTVLTK